MTSIYIVDLKANRSSVYGIGTYITELEHSLLHSELQVCFIHLNHESHRFIEKIENGVMHWYIPLPKIKYKDEEKNKRLYFQNVVFILRQYIQQTDNLVFHLNFLQSNYFVDEIKKYFKCKIVLAVHYLSWCFEIFGNTTRLQNIIRKKESRLDELDIKVKKSFNEEKDLFRVVDKVLCLSKHTAKIICKMYQVNKRNIVTIYNGLEDKRQKELDRNLIKRKYNLPIDMPVIIFAGRLDSGKGLSYLIRASKKVFERFPDAHVIIAGNGDYDTFMKECGNRWMNIHFTGLLEKSELYTLYSIADLGVMPSLHEQCSYVAIEMMMHGLPMIASNSTGLAEMIDEGITGLHVPMVEIGDKMEVDVSLLAEKITYMLDNETERKRMGVSARKRYKKLYSSEKMGKQMIQFYQNLVILRMHG